MAVAAAAKRGSPQPCIMSEAAAGGKFGGATRRKPAKSIHFNRQGRQKMLNHQDTKENGMTKK